MPSACRRIAALLIVACLGVAGPVTVVHAQTTTQSSEDLEPLTPSPQAEGDASAGGGSSTGSGTSTTETTPATTLPSTGVDVRLLVLAGASLLITGIGLRLRFAPERF